MLCHTLADDMGHLPKSRTTDCHLVTLQADPRGVLTAPRQPQEPCADADSTRRGKRPRRRQHCLIIVHGNMNELWGSRRWRSAGSCLTPCHSAGCGRIVAAWAAWRGSRRSDDDELRVPPRRPTADLQALQRRRKIFEVHGEDLDGLGGGDVQLLQLCQVLQDAPLHGTCCLQDHDQCSVSTSGWLGDR